MVEYKITHGDTVLLHSTADDMACAAVSARTALVSFIDRGFSPERLAWWVLGGYGDDLPNGEV
jgi:hypothetical protein